ncbi:double-stranded RNA-binding protein 3-like [Macadamia integrifolia]|uniref:double-stranded RNA-binding protein 3-like n=1 Tax=Macadamia integrifolia TaxID=60698 RepID=UPI001C4F1E0F|nr:double-stranded RNA-binding protein 3-like [Macadamia integrifolia]
MFLSRTFNSDIRTVTLRKMAAALASPSTSKLSVPEHVLHKNRLQEYTQRSAIPLPIYQTINEGSPHAPRFRSTVVVDGASYVSTDTFSQRKEAEQAVAKYALELISEKIKNEGCALIVEVCAVCVFVLTYIRYECPIWTSTSSFFWKFDYAIDI